MTFRIKLTVGLALAFAILLLVAVLSYSSLVRSADDRRWVTHTRLVLEGLDTFQIDLINAETGQRGYIITGDESYLEPYNDSLARILQSFRELRELTADNATQQRALDHLEPLLTAKLAELQHRIDIRKEQGLTAAAVAVAEGSGKILMDQIRALAASMKQEEERLLVGRSSELEASSRRARWIIVIGEARGFLFLCVAGFII